MENDTKICKTVIKPTYCRLTIIAPYITLDKTSFAYTSARNRWPVIVVRRRELSTEHYRLMGQDRGH